jgi:hypothetical protein
MRAGKQAMANLSANFDDTQIKVSCGRQARNFATTLDALKDFVDLIAPHVRALDEQEPQVELYREMFDQLPDKARKRAHRDFGIIVDILNNSSRDLEALYGRGLSPDAVAIVQAMMNRVNAQPKLPILLRSLMPMAVGAFEVLTAQLIGLIYHVRPGLLPRNEKDFSLSDLEQFDSLQDAIDDAIERRVDSILAGSIEDWTKWFNRKGIEIDLSRLALNWADTLEVFQRRHIILHNDGKVSKRYLARLAAYSNDLPDLGTELSTDAQYVENALDNLNVLGSLLAIFVERRLLGRLEWTTGEMLNSRVEGLMRFERWLAAQKLCAVAKTFKELRDSTRLKFQCGEWLCAKKLDGIESIRATVDRWDVSALGQEFKAIKYSLLDMDRKAATALRLALRNQEIAKPRVSESPFLHAIEQRSKPKVSRARKDAIPDSTG